MPSPSMPMNSPVSFEPFEEPLSSDSSEFVYFALSFASADQTVIDGRVNPRYLPDQPEGKWPAIGSKNSASPAVWISSAVANSHDRSPPQ